MAKNLYLKRGNWWFSRQIDGKRKWVNLHTRDEAEAIKLSRLVEHHPDLRPEYTTDEDVTAFVAYKKSKRRYSRNSAETKVLILRRFAAWLPPRSNLANVSAKQCSAFYAEVQKTVTESTAQGYMMTLRSFLRWAIDVRHLRLDNPVAKVDLLACDRVARDRFCDRAEANRLIEAAPTDDLRFILFCGFHAGLRREEISEARAHWFDLRGGALNVRRAIGKERLRAGEREWRPKHNKERTVPLTKPFRKFLQDYLTGREPLDFALQPGVGHGRNRYRYDFRRPFTDFVRVHSTTRVNPHMMRHSFASNLKIAGKSIAKIADWLGDTERVTERNYAHLKPDDRDIHALA